MLLLCCANFQIKRSISHHHGVGKHRKEFMERTIGPVGIDMIRGIKLYAFVLSLLHQTFHFESI
jgi:hypothetical protein